MIATDSSDAISWAVNNWAGGVVIGSAGLLVSLLIKVHATATETFDWTRDQLTAELERVNHRNERLDDELDEVLERERLWVRLRIELETTIGTLEAKVAQLERELEAVRLQMRSLSADKKE
jgi:chromosome segregation ATPase